MQEQFFSEQNKYEKVKILGSGATGVVYLVKNNEDNMFYAMKICTDKTLLRKESELLKRMKHPAFPRWKEYLEDVRGYLVMEVVEGTDLQTILRTEGRITSPEAEKIILDILEVLKYLHRQSPSIAYRDLKPEHIVIANNGRVRVVDLGGAVATGYKVGTYGYAAPEQFWEGITPGPECDLYASGKLLAYLLTGKNPCEPPYDMLRFCEHNKYITPQIYKVIQRSLAQDSLGRYSSTEEFSRDLMTAIKQFKRNRWRIFPKKTQIVYEKCVWKSEYERIF